MKISIRILSCVLLLLLATAFVTGCSNNITIQKETVPAATEAPTVKNDTPVFSGMSFSVTDNLNWGTAYLFAWDSEGEAVGGEWPGIELTDKNVNGLDEVQFICKVPEGAVGVLIHDGNGAQTVDITDFTSYEGYWLDGTKDAKGHYNVFGWNKNDSTETQPLVNDNDAQTEEMMDYAVNNSFSEGFCEQMNKSDLFSMVMFSEGKNLVWELTFKKELSEAENTRYQESLKKEPLTNSLETIREIVKEKTGRDDFGMIVRFRTIDGNLFLEQTS